MLVCSEAEVRETLAPGPLRGVVREALVAQARGAVERPERPHYPVGAGLDGVEAGTGIAMPAYVHGADHYATKLVGVHEGNADRDLPTVNAVLVLQDARTGLPAAVLGATALTNARTACLGALSVERFAPETATLGVVGAGPQARWQARAVATVADLNGIRVYAPSDSRERAAAALRDRGLPAAAVDTPGAAVAGADAVVTATTATEPVFPADRFAGRLVVAVGAYTPEMQELPPAVLDRAGRLVADVPAEAAATGDFRGTGYGVADLTPFGATLDEDEEGEDPAGADADAGPTVVASVGSAVLDAAAGEWVLGETRAAGVGTEV